MSARRSKPLKMSHISSQNMRQHMRRLIGAFSLLALVFVTACAQTGDVEHSTGGSPSTLATTTGEPTPQPETLASNKVDAAASDTESGPLPTLVPIEAQPTPGPDAAEARDPEPTRVSSESTPITQEPAPDATSVPPSGAATATIPTPAPTAQPAPESSPLVPVTATPVNSEATPTSTSAPAPPTPTPPPPTPTAAPTATVKPEPTPRPTPGPITRQTQFVPLDEPKYVSRDQASANITNASYVLGVVSNGESRAYPLDMMWYHHIANDTVGGEPWLITY